MARPHPKPLSEQPSLPGFDPPPGATDRPCHAASPGRPCGPSANEAGLARWAEAGFTPHLTLLYDDRCVDEQAIETIAWTAQEFVLVHSLIGQTRHVPLWRWPLRG